MRSSHDSKPGFGGIGRPTDEREGDYRSDLHRGGDSGFSTSAPRNNNKGGPTSGPDFRIDARALELDDDSLASEVIEPIWSLDTGESDHPQLPEVWNHVTTGQRHVYAVTWAEREVLNGGFWQYLWNKSADMPLKALEGYRAMGMNDYAELLEQAIAVFPDGKLPPTRNQRMALLPEDPYEEGLPSQHKAMLDKLEKLDDRFYDVYGEGEDYYKRVAAYIRAHPNEFFK